ncbi:SRPBCC family protein [Actinomadura vinacea]
MTSREDADAAERLARGLGWASLGLAAPRLLMPRAVRRASGLEHSTAARFIVPMVGARELLHAGALLAGRRPAPWTWTRVAGDAMDLALLAGALRRRPPGRGRGRGRMRGRGRVQVALTAVAGITAVDVYAAVRNARALRRAGEERRYTGAGPLHVHAAITINRPRAQVYAHWRRLENLPAFITHLESVEEIGPGRSRWTMRGLRGRTMSWEAEVTEDRPGELVAWRSMPGAEIGSHGAVRFTDAPGNRGTEVRVELRYAPPGGQAGARLARLLGEDPEQQVRDDLRRFKQVMETGEVVRSEASPEGVRAMRPARQRPAQPVA